ncbi:GspE/PulE family protein [Thalassococcus lentus]|uniref:GspE/PulE family protein n=1 Tax=Thalassococcus lentus TaxID=1210524 RepID=A0ABT4XUI3_9RHOB|nr:GspE/PulE family protein [Thalassococcus lentus]MDA7425619.1 GspE/PulE family protein [Thalassococcus lentus]
MSQSLLTSGRIEEVKIAHAQSVAAANQSTLVQALLTLGLIEEDDLLPLAAKACRMQFSEPGVVYSLNEQTLSELSHSFCLSATIAPVETEHGVVFLIADPLDHGLRNEVAFHVGFEPEFKVAHGRTIRTALKKARGPQTQNAEELRNNAPKIPVQTLDLDGPTIRYVDQLMAEAIALSASDIHLESSVDSLDIRFRIDGTLSPQTFDAQLNRNAVLARVKVMANLNVSERRLPQDGRIAKTIAGRKVDFRVSSVPTSLGESIVCRVLDPKALQLGWQNLGFHGDLRDQLINIIERPSGLFLVTGPTGSGKTTTLYTALSHLNQPDRKILTVEDPVEYSLPGVQQVQVHEEIGFTFAKALRAFLRQDPNVIMIGEIRDEETAQIACRSAMIGRLVLSTLHTASPEAASHRLVDLGVPEFLSRDVLLGAMGQTLVLRRNGGRQVEARLVTEF